MRVQPWLLDARRQTVLSLVGADGVTALALTVAPQGAGCDIRRSDSELERVRVVAPMLERRWYELRVESDGASMRLSQHALQRSWGVADSGEAAGQGYAFDIIRVIIGAEPADSGFANFFNGRIEDPCLLSGRHPGSAPIDVTAFAESADLLAWWDFSEGIATTRILDRGPRHLHGKLRNLPMRGVRGSRWDGTEMCWRHAPRAYAAIHFHADDLYDCEWQTDFTVAIPEDWPSGVYGVRLRGNGCEDTIPFYVLPPRGVAQAPIAYLAPTFTFQAYANHARVVTDDAYKQRRAEWGAYPYNPDEYPEFGACTYNRHPDNTGICYSSLRRPVLTMRPGFLTFIDARGSGLRHFAGDSHLTDWLETQGFAFDVITDHDLDREGVELLSRYRAVVTGSHPEYHTARTLDAIQDYVAGGGRLAYLGGNGFYWRIAVSDEVPDVLEIRRAEGGIRAWAADTGEYFNALDGAYGGLWRRNGRPPQLLAGIGFSAQGLFEGSYYRRMKGADDPRAAWIFDGVPETILGDFGLSGGGAAGFELDRADPRLGSPPNLVILARSEAHQSHFIPVPEEVLTHTSTVTGERPDDLIRAEIVYFETDHGGAVFSVGSITFCGSLSHDNYRNPISRMLRNVLTRFAAAG